MWRSPRLLVLWVCSSRHSGKQKCAGFGPFRNAKSLPFTRLRVTLVQTEGTMDQPAPARPTLTASESAKKSAAALDLAYGCFACIALTLSFFLVLAGLPLK